MSDDITTCDNRTLEQHYALLVSQKASRKQIGHFSFWCLTVMLWCHPGCSGGGSPVPGGDRQKTAEKVAREEGSNDPVNLADGRVPESSGLASSLRREGYFWTHNDSGHKALVYAYDRKGRPHAKVKIKGVSAKDWEDCCTFSSAGKARLLIADCGDNDRERSKIYLYLLDEPDPLESGTVTKVGRITVRYPDGARDCEAVAVDSARQQIVLLTKSFLPQSGIYVIPLPDDTGDEFDVNVTATKVGTLVLPLVTAADFDASNGDLWVTNYLQAFCFRASDRKQPLAEQLKQIPDAFDLPKWRQVEALAVDQNQNVWITSEGSPTPLGRVVCEPPAGD